MNDNAISKAITHTHFAITTAIVFCLLVISLLYLSLSSGLQLKKLKIGPVIVHELYLKWDNRLSISIDSLTLQASGPSPSSNEKSVHDRIAALLSHADDQWLGTLKINQVSLGDSNLSIEFDPKKTGRLTLHSGKSDLTFKLYPVSKYRTILIEGTGSSSEFNASIDVEGILDLHTAELYAALDAEVAHDIRLEAAVHAGTDAMRLAVRSARPFKSVAPLVRPLHLSKAIEPWIIDRAQGGPLMLHTLETTLPYDDPTKALDNLYAHATFLNARYRFADDPQAFEPAHAPRVTLLFKDKKLNIIPQDATFYGQHGGSTWLNIDFGSPHPELNLYLELRAALTPDLHRLIASYGIDLPFTQTEGLTDTALSLNVDLQSNDTRAEGEFRIDDGKINFSGLPIAVTGTRVSITDTNVTIDALHASIFDGNITAIIFGKFNPARDLGTLHFDVTRAQFGNRDASIRLAGPSIPLRFDYDIAPKGERLLFEPSVWVFDNRTIRCGAFDAAFDFDDLNVSLPAVPVTIDSLLAADVSGTVNLAKPSADIALNLHRLQAGSFHNSGDANRFRIVADDGNLSITSANDTFWASVETNISTGPIHLSGRPDTLTLAPTPITIEGQLTGTVDGKLDLLTHATELNVSAFHFFDVTLKELFASDDAFSVYVIPIEDEFDVIVPDLNMLYSTQKEGWKLHFFSLMAFRDRSELLDEYNLTQSAITVWSADGSYPIDFKGAVEYPYALTVQNGKPISSYRFEGRFESNDTVSFTINDAIHVNHTDVIRIDSQDIAFNLPEAIRFYQEHRFGSDINASGKSANVFIDANNTAIVFSDGRSAIADAIKIQYENDRIYAQLYKSNGGAMLEVKNDRFYLFGNDLDDEFMEHFFKLSRFKGGALDFYVVGDKHDFNGLVKIDGTTIYDFVLLNNLFAFINTVPALVTFSLPSYATKGIKVKSAYAELKYHEGNLTISSLKVDSKEMDFAGQGLVDYNRGKMDMQLSVKTQAGDNIRKIPLVGYILVGDDQSVLTTVNVKGDIKNPKISSTIAKDIIVAPFNLLKRALDFPIHYLEKIDTKGTTPSKKKKPTHQITSGTPSYK